LPLPVKDDSWSPEKIVSVLLGEPSELAGAMG